MLSLAFQAWGVGLGLLRDRRAVSACHELSPTYRGHTAPKNPFEGFSDTSIEALRRHNVSKLQSTELLLRQSEMVGQFSLTDPRPASSFGEADFLQSGIASAMLSVVVTTIPQHIREPDTSVTVKQFLIQWGKDMPKVSPEELWKRKVLERVRRFMQSPDLIRLRKIGQTILDRDTLVGPEEWWDRAGGLMNTPEYRAFEVCCEEVGHEYGLAQWTVEWASLMRDYDPTEQDHVLEAEWPSIHVVTVVTDVTEDLFLRWLIYEAGRMGLYVQQQTGSTVTPVIAVPMEEPPGTAP